MPKLIISLFVLLSLLSGTGWAGQREQEPLTLKLDRVIEQAIKEKRLVGAVAAVSHNGRTLYFKASGLADRESGRPMTTDTLFRLASMSKPIVSVAVLRLVDRGLIGLDDPVTRWLPDFRPRTADGRFHPITVRQLLTHTSGLSYGFFEKADGPYHRLGVSDGLDDRGVTLDDNLRRLAQAPLLFAPGSGWNYSLATDVLGGVIEKATGRDLASAVRELVTEPLAMKETTFTASQPERLAVPYADGKPHPVRMTDFYRLPFGLSTVDFSPARAFNAKAYPSGGAGLISTTSDYLAFLENIRTGAGKLLKSDTERLIFTSGAGNGKLPGMDPGWGWGIMSALLLDNRATGYPACNGTISWGGVYGGSWWVDRESGLSVVLLTNTAIEGMVGKLPRALITAVYESLRRSR